MSETPKKRANIYVVDKQLLNDAGRLSFNNATGNILSTAFFKEGEVTSAVPGIMAINFLPTVGASFSSNSPLNVAAQRLYTYVVHMNSRPGSYDATDLMQVLIALDSIYLHIISAVRVYGLMHTYSQKNKYLAECLVNSCGYDFNDLNTHLSDFRSAINVAITKAQIFAIPRSLKFIVNHLDLVQNIFVDENSLKGQFYLWKPIGYYIYDEVSARNTFNGYNYYSVPDGYVDDEFITVSDWVNIFNSMFDPIRNSESANIMFGDILKAYGNEALMKLPLLPDQYVTPIIDDYYMKQRIHNSMSFIRSEALARTNVIERSLDITQNGAKEYLVATPLYYHGSASYVIGANVNKTYIDLGDDTSPELVMEATRGITFASANNTTEASPAQLTEFGTEIIFDYTIYTFARNRSGLYVDSWAFCTFNTVDGASQTSLNQVETVTRTISKLSQFNYAPKLIIGILNGTSINVSTVWNMDNYTELDEEIKSKLDQCALLSLYNVPLSGSWNQ